MYADPSKALEELEWKAQFGLEVIDIQYDNLAVGAVSSWSLVS